MPGYEVHSGDGTLIMRVRHGDYSPISEDLLRDWAIALAPKDVLVADVKKDSFKILPLLEDDYVKKRDDEIANKEIQRFDGTKESLAVWESTYDILTQTNSKDPNPIKKVI